MCVCEHVRGAHFQGFDLLLTHRRIFIDEEVGLEEVVQEAWRLVGGCDREREGEGEREGVRVALQGNQVFLESMH